ncbi:MAG: ParB/RepB/Spo0J family partition protein [Leptospiraceae bacterium]|nr:ParB/RepB/Spo0J family partition protein [Leptospiraceae bacterium]MCP5502276.1 ParB/RepB/Spo0J family partition protein [Leptospiraceae bacterium]
MSKKNDFATLDLLSTYESKKEQADRISLSLIHPSSEQPRIFGKEKVEDLTDSMKRLGLIEPIVLRRSGDEYYIIAGERRFRAAKELGWIDIPAVIFDVNEDSSFEMALAENDKRKNLNPYEVGKAIRYLREGKGKTAEQVAGMLGYSERYIKQLSSIARLEEITVFEFLEKGFEPSIKNLEKLLKKQEGRGDEMVSPLPKKQSIRINLDKLEESRRVSFLEELNLLKEKYGIQ